MFLIVVALLIFMVSLLFIIFTEQVIAFLIFQQRQILHFLGFSKQGGDNSGSVQDMWDRFLDLQEGEKERFRYRKLWVRLLALVLILFDILVILFYWLSVQYSS